MKFTPWLRYNGDRTVLKWNWCIFENFYYHHDNNCLHEPLKLATPLRSRISSLLTSSPVLMQLDWNHQHSGCIMLDKLSSTIRKADANTFWCRFCLQVMNILQACLCKWLCTSMSFSFHCGWYPVVLHIRPRYVVQHYFLSLSVCPIYKGVLAYIVVHIVVCHDISITVKLIYSKVDLQ